MPEFMSGRAALATAATATFVNWKTVIVPRVPVQPTGAVLCQPWCVEHVPDSEGGICHAEPMPAPTEPTYPPGRVLLGYDTEDGALIHLNCKVDDLTAQEAEQLARAILAQVDRAARINR